MLVDEDQNLAVWTALARHPPSLRVYRALLELTLLLFCAALSLYVWPTRAVGKLLFQPPQEFAPIRYQRYRAVSVAAIEDDRVFTQEEANDAMYDSDGEVEEETAYTEPPTATAVTNAALDSLLLILVSLFLFTISSAEGGKYIEGISPSHFQLIARIAAPVFPLALFLLALLKAVLPFSKRKHFWIIMSYTMGAPLYEVTFRDGFIGDCFTSSVRPMQDLAFTVFYIVSGLRGWWTQAYDLDNADLPLETSWLLHTVVLPACMVVRMLFRFLFHDSHGSCISFPLLYIVQYRQSPLWWRFLQNLRQSHDNKKRWPYLGNALKYFVAAQVSMVGLFDPSKKSKVLWLLAFVGATLYQIWWDVFMDWELLEFQPNRSFRLRSSRLYKSRTMYWTIFGVNCVLRFGWTLSFLPQWYLDSSGMLLKTFDGHVARVVGPTIASAEIIRRMLWGFLRLELEAIKTCVDDPQLKEELRRSSSEESGIDLKDMSEDLTEDLSAEPSIFRSKTSPMPIELRSDMSSLSDLQILGELCLWATAFAAFGFVAAAHRATM
jgi:hypothetical protein